MRENRTSGSMRRGERRSDGPLGGWTPTRKGGNRGAPPDLYATALAPHSTERAQGDRAGDVAGRGMGPVTTVDSGTVTREPFPLWAAVSWSRGAGRGHRAHPPAPPR